MKTPIRAVAFGLVLLVAGAGVGRAFETDKIRAELTGRVVFFEQAGLVERQMDSKVELLARAGQIRRMEIYTEWSGPNGQRQISWEFYQVRGRRFAGYVERIYSSDTEELQFSRTEVSGIAKQEINGKSGSGRISWEFSNESSFDDIDDDVDDVDDDGVPDDIDDDVEEPVVTADEEGELDIALRREITFKADWRRDTDRPTVTLFEEGDESLNENLARRQEAFLEGRGRGSLAYDEAAVERQRDADVEEAQPDPTPTPSPAPDGGIGDEDLDDGGFEFDGGFEDGLDSDLGVDFADDEGMDPLDGETGDGF